MNRREALSLFVAAIVAPFVPTPPAVRRPALPLQFPQLAMYQAWGCYDEEKLRRLIEAGAQQIRDRIDDDCMALFADGRTPWRTTR